jgi:Divergent InlB B-repeat domain
MGGHIKDGGMARAGRPMMLVRAWIGFAICAGVFLLAQVPSAQGDPINTARPTITGKLEVGQTLTVNPGTWTDPTSRIVRYEYGWGRCVNGECLAATFGNGPELTIPPELDGEQTAVGVIAIDEAGKEGFAYSEETAIITDNIAHYAVSEQVSGGGSLTGAANGQTGAYENLNLDCPGSCGETSYASGTSIELTARPEPGAAFLGWGGACSGTAQTCSFVVSANVTVTASFTPAPLPNAGPLPVLEGREADEPGESGGPAAGGAAAGASVLGSEGTLGQGEVLASSVRRLPARLLGLRALRGRHLQAALACQQAKACHLTLALSSEAPGARLVASRSITLQGGSLAHVGLALNREGARILARRRRLPVTAHLVLHEGGRSVAVGGAHLTLGA